MKFRVLSCALLALLAASASAQETNVLSLGEGALLVAEAAAYGGGWTGIGLLDDAATTGWASESGKLTNHAFVVELPAATTISAFEFDTASIDGDRRGAKDVVVEVSPAGKDAGFVEVLRASLEDRKDRQRFPAAKKVEGRWVRLKIANNHGDAEYTELMGFRGYGPRVSTPPLSGVTGTYETSYGDFHVRQQGTAITGCYEHNEGLFDGSFEGRVAKLTWNESKGQSKGPAVFVFTPDARSFSGHWWSGDDKHGVDGEWAGRRKSAEVGSCPHWSGSVGGELKKQIAATGRARLYGILFDTDSAKLRPESLPTLDEVAKLLAGEPSWSLTIEGHTDATGTAPHNQTLSEQRAASVKDYLVAKGIAAARLASAGFGQSKPVADNATELGRAQNRRVELVRK